MKSSFLRQHPHALFNNDEFSSKTYNNVSNQCAHEITTLEAADYDDVYSVEAAAE